MQKRGALRSEEAAAAMAAVPREAFLDPDLPIEAAYLDEPILLKRGGAGTVISTISQPSMIAGMLDQLKVREGNRILEIGTASGYNAALLAHLTGPAGLVVSVELEADLAVHAARALRSTGNDNAVVLCADGRLGWPGGAPYDRIIVTAAAHGIEDAWWSQLREGGRLVVPVAGEGLCHAYEKRGGVASLRSSIPAAFVPLRTSPDDPGSTPPRRRR